MRHARSDYNRIQDPHEVIPKDEPVFLLRGQDKHAAAAVAYYATRLAKDPDVEPALAMRCLEWSIEMRGWEPKKSPDAPPATIM